MHLRGPKVARQLVAVSTGDIHFDVKEGIKKGREREEESRKERKEVEMMEIRKVCHHCCTVG